MECINQGCGQPNYQANILTQATRFIRDRHFTPPLPPLTILLFSPYGSEGSGHCPDDNCFHYDLGSPLIMRRTGPEGAVVIMIRLVSEESFRGLPSHRPSQLDQAEQGSNPLSFSIQRR